MGNFDERQWGISVSAIMAAGVVLGVIALGGIAVLHADAPRLFHGLTHRTLALVISSAVAGATSLVLLLRRRYVMV